MPPAKVALSRFIQSFLWNKVEAQEALIFGSVRRGVHAPLYPPGRGLTPAPHHSKKRRGRSSYTPPPLFASRPGETGTWYGYLPLLTKLTQSP
jgi:hypothetical protein